VLLLYQMVLQTWLARYLDTGMITSVDNGLKNEAYIRMIVLEMCMCAPAAHLGLDV
jgi:hypothetical protein